MLRTRFSQSIRWLSGTGALALFLSAFIGVAAHGESGLDGVIRDGATREAMEALARNEAPIRDAALLVSTRPDLVVQVEGIRSWTSRAFEQILDEQPEDARDDLWELVRYPELVDAMVEPGAQGRLEEVVATHPADVRASALAAAKNSWGAVLRIHRLQGETDDAVNEILDRLEPALANALGLLVDEPAALSVLAENLNLTVALGEAYEDDPTTVRAELSQLAADVALADQTERTEWAQQLEDDPSLRAEVDDASDSWQDEYGAADDFEPTVPALRYVHPYPYWYGYPHHAADFYIPAAHAHTLWYPRSYWGHSGYYYGAGHTLVVFSAPSFPFLHWLRYRHPHHRVHSVHRGFGRLRHIGYWDGYGNRRHHAHHYRQHRPNRKAHHTRSRRAHHRSDARRHNGLRPDRSFNQREHRPGRHSLGRGEARRYGDRRASRVRTHRNARADRGNHETRARRDARDRRGKRDRHEARDRREKRDRHEARDRRETRDRRGERERAGERKARKNEKRRTREQTARGNEQRRARGEAKRSKRVRETKPRVARRDSRAGETRQRRVQERKSSRTERRAKGEAQRRIASARPAPVKREKPRAQRSRGNSQGRAVSPRPAKKQRQQARQQAESRSRKRAKPSSLARSVAPRFSQARPAKAQQAQRKQKARGNQRAKAKRRKGGRSERKRR